MKVGEVAIQNTGRQCQENQHHSHWCEEKNGEQGGCNFPLPLMAVQAGKGASNLGSLLAWAE